MAVCDINRILVPDAPGLRARARARAPELRVRLG